MRFTRLLRAGAGHHGYKPTLKDPAIERWFQMREDMYKGFTFTRENTVPVLSLVFVVPAVIYYFFDSDLKRGWDIRMTTHDTTRRLADRRPEDLQKGLMKETGQYDF